MYEWDNDFAEDAKFAMNLGFFSPSANYPRCCNWILANRTLFAFPTQHPHKICGKNSRVVSKVHPDLGFIGNFTLVMHRQMVVIAV
jgi:hypothetical protein